jgi:hypothetical protein
MMCPVCLSDILVDDGVVKQHFDTTGITWCPMSGKEPIRWNERTTREAVAGRSGGYCEYCGHRATNMHHRVNRSQGGGWSPVNILHLCGSGTTGCHGFFTHQPELAYEMGVSVHRADDPAAIPVRTPTQLLWLTDDITPPFPQWAR